MFEKNQVFYYKAANTLHAVRSTETDSVGEVSGVYFGPGATFLRDSRTTAGETLPVRTPEWIAANMDRVDHAPETFPFIQAGLYAGMWCVTNRNNTDNCYAWLPDPVAKRFVVRPIGVLITDTWGAVVAKPEVEEYTKEQWDFALRLVPLLYPSKWYEAFLWLEDQFGLNQHAAIVLVNAAVEFLK